MKLAKISLAAAVALGALSTASFAQPLEEAIKGVDVSGYLRYRYNDDRYSDRNNVKDASETSATHQYKVKADFKTPVVNNVAFNLGILYHNDQATTNRGSGTTPGQGTEQFFGTGLGAGEDGNFGVSTFYATYTPDSTKTTVMIGKQLLNTPVTNAGDEDRGTGILALNSDIPNWTFAAGAFDTFAINDLMKGYIGNERSVTKGLYTLAALANYGDFTAQAWAFAIEDVVKNLFFVELAYKYSMFGIKGQYAYAALDNGDNGLYGKNYLGAGDELAKKNSLYTIEATVDYKPVDFKLGYIGSGNDGYSVSLDDEGKFSKAGKLWWQNNATGVSISALPLGSKALPGKDKEDELTVVYVDLGYKVLDNLRLNIEYVDGEAKFKSPGVANDKREFTELTPGFNYQYSKNLNLSGYYAMLKTDTNTPGEEDEKRNRARLQALYKF
ncbi:Porin [Wolinella succinogenes]|uniref:major outer membrane protein n=1 Tax=Wolinella succinogenes TaxID=844 RepID=UPI000F6C05FB|nr:major outer membrane protein [Wolinella succinogenes]VEG80957.1 Porin [Wolinella succinogenes]